MLHNAHCSTTYMLAIFSLTAGYTFVEGNFAVTPEIKADFDKKGYVLVRSVGIEM